jgi:uncharacterized protein (TIGR00255 family)
MIKSMTGFGKASCELPLKKITIDIKSVNSKQLDFNLKLPYIYREKEIEIRNIISGKLERGKIDVYVNTENTGGVSNYSINRAVAIKYYEELRGLSTDIGRTDFNDYLPIIIKLPEVLKSESTEIEDEEANQFVETFVKALNQLDEFRRHEGEVLENDFINRIDIISKLNEAVEPYEKERILRIKEKLTRSLNEVIEENKFDKNRLEQELVYFIEKIDFTEERVRLKKHLHYFTETLRDKESNGKKLNFIVQEIGREINTLGSKANDAEIQKIVVQMKDELEKIKEQLMNVL